MDYYNGQYYTHIQIPFLPSDEEEIDVQFTLPNDGGMFNFSTVTFENKHGSGYLACCNVVLDASMNPTIIDSSLPAFVLQFFYNDGDEDDPVVNVMSYTDYTNATLSIGKKTIKEKKEYVLLPDTALGLGREIVTETEINNDYTTTLSSPSATSPFVMWKNISTTPDRIDDDIQDGTSFSLSYVVNGENIEIDRSVLFTNATLDSMFNISSTSTGYWGVINSTQSIDQILSTGMWTRADSSKPTLVVCLSKNNQDGHAWLTLAAPELLVGDTFILNLSTVEIKSSRVKLPNEALNFDSEPTEGSTNLVNSGDLYNFIGDIQVVLDEINALIGE